MLIPIRCFSCGTVVAHLYEPYKERVEKGEDSGAVLNDLGVKKICCRRMLVSQVDLIDIILPYNK